jgi:hypothetical protein
MPGMMTNRPPAVKKRTAISRQNSSFLNASAGVPPG